MKKVIAASAIALALVGGCAMPEDDINSGKHKFSQKGNGAQAKKEAPKKQKTDSGLTPAQENAVGQAQNYLDNMGGFSHKGLVEQLKFEGYSLKDATFAVDHIKVNWNDEAAKKAKQYLNGQSFSRSGLIEQLKFEGFTPAQAEYGVTQAGL